MTAASVPSPQEVVSNLSWRDVRQEMTRRLARRKFIWFIRAIAPWFRIEEVHLWIAETLEQVAEGKLDRLMIFMPPRTGKSQMLSIFYPAWYIGRFPSRKVMQVSYKADLAVGFGRQVRDLLNDPDYRAIFPDVHLRGDVKAAGYWQVLHAQEDEPNGEYYAAGVGGGIAGKGFNLGIIDDPLSEQDATSDVVKERVREWYGPGFYTRRQPEDSAIIVISTRWALDDLPGFLLEQAEDPDNEYADQWHKLVIGAVIDDEQAETLTRYSKECAEIHQSIERMRAAKANDEPDKIKPVKFKAGDSFAPRRWPKRELLRQQGNMSNRNWLALYQQKPTGDQGNILLAPWWREWKRETPPKCELIVACYDTAFEEEEESDFSARTTWGVFTMGGRWMTILLERWQQQVGFPELREEAIAHAEHYEPDLILIEKRASGHSLLQELRRKGLPARAWLPRASVMGGRARGKRPRAHAASIILEQGCVWYMKRKWAQEVIDQCAAFPYAEHDDLTDTVTMMLLWLREHRALDLEDELDEDDEPQDTGRRRLYGTAA